MSDADPHTRAVLRTALDALRLARDHPDRIGASTPAGLTVRIAIKCVRALLYGERRQADAAPACPPHSDAPAVAPAGVSIAAPVGSSCPAAQPQTGASQW